MPTVVTRRLIPWILCATRVLGQGSPEARRLIQMYGEARAKGNDRGALELAQQAADTGDPEGKHLLADAYRFGVGTPVSRARALEIFLELVEEHRDVRAAYEAGILLAKGGDIGRKRDLPLARKLLEQVVSGSAGKPALSFFHTQASRSLAFVKQGRDPDGGTIPPEPDAKEPASMTPQALVEQAQALARSGDPGSAFALARKAADTGDPAGLRYLAWCHRVQIGTGMDLAEALRLYRIGVEKHHDPESAVQAAQLIATGRGIGRRNDPAEAGRLLEKAIAWSEGRPEHGAVMARAREHLANLRAGRDFVTPTATVPRADAARPGMTKVTGEKYPPGTTFDDGRMKQHGGGFTHLVEGFDPRTGKYRVLMRVPGGGSCTSCAAITRSALDEATLDRLGDASLEWTLCPACGGTNQVSEAVIDPATGKQRWRETRGLTQVNGAPGMPVTAGMKVTSGFEPVFISTTCGGCKGSGQLRRRP